MPVYSANRQVNSTEWFNSASAQRLLNLQYPIIAQALQQRPTQAWLWITPHILPTQPLPAYGLRLHLTENGLAGDLRCQLPLPIESESIGNIILQHSLEVTTETLLAECARVLMPGGRLWIFALNPYSPYRLRWFAKGIHCHSSGYWKNRCNQQYGLTSLSTHYLGMMICSKVESKIKISLPPLQAAYCLQLEKRAHAGIGLTPAKQRWQPSSIPANAFNQSIHEKR